MWRLVCEPLGKMLYKVAFTKKTFEFYHIYHINKVTMTAFTAFGFTDSIENGGEALKLGIFRAQNYKVAEKEV